MLPTISVSAPILNALTAGFLERDSALGTNRSGFNKFFWEIALIYLLTTVLTLIGTLIF